MSSRNIIIILIVVVLIAVVVGLSVGFGVKRSDSGMCCHCCCVLKFAHGYCVSRRLACLRGEILSCELLTD